MLELIVPLEGLLLMFVLGLRHGLDPDHIAMVDSIAYGRSGQARRAWSTGAMFAAGHGAAVTVAAIVMQALRREFALPEPWATLFAWLPVALLLVAGTANLRSLLRAGQYRPDGAARMLLSRIGSSSHPLAAFGIGVLFAMVFDTSSQLAAWGYASNVRHGPTAALLVGLAFTAGMIVVDSLDGYLMNRLLANPDVGQRERYRRMVGWLTVVAAYGVAAHGAASNLWPAFELDEDTFTIMGAGMVGSFLVLSLWSRWRRIATPIFVLTLNPKRKI